MLALLLVKPNRCPQAWWIWVPLGSLALLASFLTRALDWLPSPLNQVFSDLVLILGFGSAATWLLAAYLGPRHRALTFLGLLGVAGGFGLVAFVFSQDWTEVGGEVGGLAIIGGLGALVFALALTLAGLICRKHYRPMRLCLYALLMILGLWTLITAPFVLFAFLVSNGAPAGLVENLVLPLFGITGVSFVALAPFLLLSFWNSFFRDRLRNLLKLGLTSSVPPVIRAPAEALAGVGK